MKQFGKVTPVTNSMDTTQLGSVASIAIDQAANEIFLADGYSNHRIIVLDAESLAYKRMWGANGKQPTDMKMKNYEPEAPQFANPVHCVKISNDGFVYVCDRSNLRIQVFQKNGTFVKQFTIRPETRGTGSAYDLAFWPDRNQTYMVIADGANGEGDHRAALRRRGSRRLRPLRPAGGTIPQPPPGRHGYEGQHLHRRSRHRHADPEIRSERAARALAISRSEQDVPARYVHPLPSNSANVSYSGSPTTLL